MHSVHFLGSMTKVPPFSEMARLGHSASQAEQLVHCEAIIFKAIRRSFTGLAISQNEACLNETCSARASLDDLLCSPQSSCGNQCSLADRSIAALHMLDFAPLDLAKIFLEPGDG